MAHDDLLEAKLNVDAEPLFGFDNLPGMDLGQRSSILTHCQSLHSPRDLIGPVPALLHQLTPLIRQLPLEKSYSREEPVPHFHEEREYAQEPAGQLHPEPRRVGHPDSPE